MNDQKEAQARFYDEWFGEFEYANSLQLSRAASILAALLETELDRPRILDFGCGTGWLSNILSTFGPTLGVDLSPQAIANAQQRFPNARFEAVDIFNSDLPPNSFDVVVSQEVLEHVEDQPGYLEFAANTLRDNGYLILTTPAAETMMAMPEQQRKEWSDQPIENWLTTDQLRRLLSRRFKDIRITTMIFGMGSKGSYRLVNSAKVVNLMAKSKLNRPYDKVRARLGYGLHIMATCRKK